MKKKILLKSKDFNGHKITINGSIYAKQCKNKVNIIQSENEQCFYYSRCGDWEATPIERNEEQQNEENFVEI